MLWVEEQSRQVPNRISKTYQWSKYETDWNQNDCNHLHNNAENKPSLTYQLLVFSLDLQPVYCLIHFLIIFVNNGSHVSVELIFYPRVVTKLFWNKASLMIWLTWSVGQLPGVLFMVHGLAVYSINLHLGMHSVEIEAIDIMDKPFEPASVFLFLLLLLYVLSYFFLQSESASGICVSSLLLSVQVELKLMITLHQRTILRHAWRLKFMETLSFKPNFKLRIIYRSFYIL